MNTNYGFDKRRKKGLKTVESKAEALENGRQPKGHQGKGHQRSSDLAPGLEKLIKGLAQKKISDKMPNRAVQKLYTVCRASFVPSNSPPSQQSVENVRSVLDEIKCKDVGLEQARIQSQEAANGKNGRRPPPLTTPVISYLHLYECDNFSMGIFCLPLSAVIPLHNHPGMTVISKLLYGSMHVKSYDWVDPFDEALNADPSQPRLAKLVKDHVLTAPCEPFILYPSSGGNIHAFTAVTSCAVLDVLAPPYSSSRHCTYYQLSSFSGTSEIPPDLNEGEEADPNSENYVWLEEFQPPSDFIVKREDYFGPRVRP